MAFGPIKLIGTKLTSTLSAESLKKKEKLPSLVFSYLLSKLDRPGYERKYGWQDDRSHYSRFRLRSWPNHHRDSIGVRIESNWSDDTWSLVNKLEETDGFYVDDEPRLKEVIARHRIDGFYRLYPYYEWDPTQIQQQVAILKECSRLAVTTHNKRTGDHLTFHKLVSANMLLYQRPPRYFITFKAYLKGQSSREYVTRVSFRGYNSAKNTVYCFRPVLTK